MTPGLMVLTDRRMAADAGHDLVDVVGAVVGAGAPTILLREKDLSRADRHGLAASGRDRRRRGGTRCRR